ncbi:MAG TPA: hypothetical protein ENK46_13770 [Flavobacteriia bacterium]|jgi:hypothetical protein|nr:hypothetical protein [Flavobacteriia bacterium]
MRKLIYVFVFAAIGLVSTTTFAQEDKENSKAAIQEKVQDKVEVTINELPEAVTKTLGEQYAAYTAEKAYKATKDKKEVYYVKLVKGEDYIKVLIDADGKVIEKKDIKQLNKIK